MKLSQILNIRAYKKNVPLSKQSLNHYLQAVHKKEGSVLKNVSQFWWFWLTLLHPDYTNTAPAGASASSDRVVPYHSSPVARRAQCSTGHRNTLRELDLDHKTTPKAWSESCLHLSEIYVAKWAGAAVLIMWIPARPEAMSKLWSVMNAQHPYMIQKFKSQQKIAEAQLYIESGVLILKQKV